MNGLGLGATLSALFGLGAGGQPTMGTADVFALHGWRFTLKPSALALCLALPAHDSATSRRHH